MRVRSYSCPLLKQTLSTKQTLMATLHSVLKVEEYLNSVYLYHHSEDTSFVLILHCLVLKTWHFQISQKWY